MDQYCSGNIYSLTNNPTLQPDPIGTIDLSTHLGIPTSVRTTQNWSNIFPITRELGVSLEKPALELSTTVLCYSYKQTTSMLSIFQPHNQFQKIFGKFPIVSLYVTRDPDVQDFDLTALVFVMKLCNCEACRNPIRRIDIAEIKPSRVRVTVKLPWRDNKTDILLTFFPGVTDRFNMSKDVDLCDPSNVLLYTNRLKIQSLEPIPFNCYENALHRVVASVKEEERRLLVEWFPPEVEERRIVRRGKSPPHSGKMFLLPDMELKSLDGKRFACHSRVISAQGHAGEITPGRDDSMLLVEVSADAGITKAFIDWMYFQDTTLLARLSFKERIRLLNLACQFKILKLIGIMSKWVMQTMEQDDFSWHNEDMWRLYCGICAVDKIQIVVRLKKKIIAGVQKLQQPGSKVGKDRNEGAAYMDNAFFKLLVNVVEKDQRGEPVVVKFL